MPDLLQLPPLSLYIHIPWCEKKCPYCDFNSHVPGGAGIAEQDYIQHLKRNLQEQLDYVQGRKLKSIFIGGGTPSLFSPQAIATILDFCEQQIGFDDTIEITLEANPGSSEQDKFRGFLEAGINRLSIGIQSFHDRHLHALGRIHNSKQASSAIEAAHTAGFKRINIDLMHGLAGQTVSEAMSDIKMAIDAGVGHISWYQLTIEPNTVFYSRPPDVPDDIIIMDIQAQGKALLATHGFKQYEISAYSQQGEASKHNLNYWQFGDYLAIGAGAHGKITLPGNNRIIRFQSSRKPDDFLSREDRHISRITDVEPQERLLECLMNGLRLNQGIDYEDCLAFTGCSPVELQEKLSCIPDCEQFIELGERIRPTDKGRLWLNHILEKLV